MLTHYSYKTFRLASLLAALAFASPAIAAPEDSYTVEKIAVDADGKDTNDARTKALAQSEQEAFKQLITKLAPQKAADIIAKTPANRIAAAVRGFEVVEERMTATHYHAVVTYHFTPQQIQTIIPSENAPATTENAPAPAAPGINTANGKSDAAKLRKAVLVIPVYNDSRTTTKLWQDDNKWRNIWYESALESGGGLVVVPLGDMNDRVDIDDANAQDANYQSLSRMYERYGVGEIEVMTAFYNLRADPKPALEVNTRRITATGVDTTRTSFTIRSTETLETLMARASNELAKSIYKQQTIDRTKIEFQRQKEIGARVNVSSIDDWVSLRKHLLAHGNITGIRLTSVSNSQIFMIISYKGTPDMLGKTLVASGLRVLVDGDSLVLALK